MRKIQYGTFIDNVVDAGDHFAVAARDLGTLKVGKTPGLDIRVGDGIQCMLELVGDTETVKIEPVVGLYRNQQKYAQANLKFD